MKIALSSNGPLSGKTTLARYLQAHYHFAIACHVCTLVESFVEYENNANYPYHEMNVHEVFENKEFYRQALQNHALRVGFHDDTMLGYWIDRTIAKGMAQLDSSTLLRGDYNIVFDPIRGEKQAQYLHDAGWTIAQLQISEEERERRACRMGKDYRAIVAATQRRPDIENSTRFADVEVDGERLVSDIAAQIVEFAHDNNSTNPAFNPA